MKKATLLVIGISFVLLACDSDKDKNDELQNVDQPAFLSNTSANIILPAYSELELSLEVLNTAIDSFAANRNQARLDDAQSKLKTAYVSWQKVSHFEFGPAETAGLKSSVNIFPVDTTQVENNILNGNTNLDALSNKIAKGFPALDYLLHHSGDNAVLINFSNQNRVDYLKLVMADLSSIISSVSNDWLAYQSTFRSATGTDVGSSAGMLVNALNQHFEKFFRDNKIGIPLGVRSSGIARPEFSEALYGSYSVELAIANLDAMKNLYSGNTGYGLDDYLEASDASGINSSILAQFDLIKMKLTALNDPLPEQIQNNPEAVQSAYNEMQKLIVLLKVDLPSRMGVLITYQDNDGD